MRSRLLHAEVLVPADFVKRCLAEARCCIEELARAAEGRDNPALTGEPGRSAASEDGGGVDEDCGAVGGGMTIGPIARWRGRTLGRTPSSGPDRP